MARKKIMFVSHGNICRSPLAQALFERIAAERGVAAEFEVDSAGVADYHIGEPVDPRMAQAAEQKGVHLKHTARRLKPSDLENYDLILVMDRKNLDAIDELTSDRALKRKVRLLRDFDPQKNGQEEVADPWYGGMRGFRETVEVIERTCSTLLDELQTPHGVHPA